MAVQDRGSMPYNRTVAQLQTMPQTSGSAAIVIYEPNATTHTAYAIGLNSGITNQKVSYYGVKKGTTTSELTLSSASTNTEYFASVTTVSDPTQTFFTIPASSTSCITFYFWMEGQDVDCTNFVAGRTIHAELKFIGNAVNGD